MSKTSEEMLAIRRMGTGLGEMHPLGETPNPKHLAPGNGPGKTRESQQGRTANYAKYAKEKLTEGREEAEGWGLGWTIGLWKGKKATASCNQIEVPPKARIIIVGSVFNRVGSLLPAKTN